MANYYTQFSASLKLESKAEKDWCLKELKKLKKKEEKLDGDSNTAESNFAYEIPSGIDSHVWFHEDESGDPAHVAKFVQRFLKKFHPHNYWCVEYAVTCSKHRSDGFGGGALFVTADEIKNLNSYHWIEEQTLAYADSSSRECQNSG